MTTLKSLAVAATLALAISPAAYAGGDGNNGNHNGQNKAHTNNGHHCVDHGKKDKPIKGKGHKRGHHHGHTHCSGS